MRPALLCLDMLLTESRARRTVPSDFGMTAGSSRFFGISLDQTLGYLVQAGGVLTGPNGQSSGRCSRSTPDNAARTPSTRSASGNSTTNSSASTLRRPYPHPPRKTGLGVRNEGGSHVALKREENLKTGQRFHSAILLHYSATLYGRGRRRPSLPADRCAVGVQARNRARDSMFEDCRRKYVEDRTVTLLCGIPKHRRQDRRRYGGRAMGALQPIAARGVCSRRSPPPKISVPAIIGQPVERPARTRAGNRPSFVACTKQRAPDPLFRFGVGWAVEAVQSPDHNVQPQAKKQGPARPRLSCKRLAGKGLKIIFRICDRIRP